MDTLQISLYLEYYPPPSLYISRRLRRLHRICNNVDIIYVCVELTLMSVDQNTLQFAKFTSVKDVSDTILQTHIKMFILHCLLIGNLDPYKSDR